MYDIGIPEIKCTNRYEDDGCIKYDAVAITRPAKCPNTEIEHDYPRLHIHSSKQNLLKDVRTEGKMVYINLSIKRYRCSECGAIISDEFTFYDKHSHMTNRLRKEFGNRYLNGETFSNIARDYGVDHKTVAAACKNHVFS